MNAPSALDMPGDAPRESLSRRLARVATSSMPALAGAGIFVLVWQLLIVVGGLRPFILPGPGTVAARLITAWSDGTMEPHALATLEEILLGFVCGSMTGMVVGYVLARSRRANLVLSPYLVAAQSTPILALGPVFTIWFGSGQLTVVLICSLIVFFPVAVSTLVGLRTVDRRLLELAQSLRATRRQILLTLEVPAALPSVMGGLRVGVTLSVVGAIIGEWSGVDRGLGLLLNVARGSLFDTPLVFATLVTIAFIGVTLYTVTVFVERRLVGPRG